MSDFQDFESLALKINKQELSSTTYVGYARDQSVTDADAGWLIKRISTSGNLTEVVYASQAYDKVWNDRTTYFGAAPFNNSNSILYDGANDYVLIGDVAPLSFERTSPFSISLWFRTSVTAERILFSKQATGNGLGYRLVSVSGRLDMHLSGGAAGNRIEVRTTPTIYADDAWHNVVVTYSGSSTAAGVIFYMDGAAVAMTVSTDTLVSTIITTTPAQISGRAGTSQNFEGFIDEVAVWDTTLTATDALNIYNLGTPSDLNMHTKAANLVCWYRADNDTFPNILDKSNVSNNLDGVMTNMTASDIVGEAP